MSNEQRAIAAQLVDIRNVGMHKVVKLTIHAPQEQAMQIMKLFGWPTGVDPVPVALARLNEEGGGAADPKHDQSVDTPPAPQTARAGRATVAPEKRLAQRAAILCGDPVFQRFLRERHSKEWHWHSFKHVEPTEIAAHLVRKECAVDSRAHILPNTAAGSRFDELYSRFIAWRDVPAEVA